MYLKGGVIALLKKAGSFLPVAGVVLFLGIFIFTLYAFNHPEGGFAFEISAETTLAIYFSYVGITFLVLVAGSVLLFSEGFDNAIQKSGAVLFLIGVIFLLLYLTFGFIPMFTRFDPLVNLLPGLLSKVDFGVSVDCGYLVLRFFRL